MRKILSVLITVGCLLMLASCGETEEPESANSETNSTMTTEVNSIISETESQTQTESTTGKSITSAKTTTRKTTNTISTQTQTPSTVKFPQVWASSFSPYQLADTSQWNYTIKNLDTIICFIDDVAAMDGVQLEAFCKMVLDNNLKVTIECGGLCPWLIDSYKKGTNAFADSSVDNEFMRISRLLDYGVTPSYLMFDDPFWRAMYPDGDTLSAKKPYMSVQEAAEQTAFAMVSWRKYFPNIQFSVNPNFPNWGWKGNMAYFPYFGRKDARGDYYQCIDAMSKAAKAKGITMFSVIADSPYDYMIGRKFSACNAGVDSYNWWERMLDLEKEVESRGLKFGIHFNSQTQALEGTDAGYYNETREYINKYKEKGGSPSIYSVESWWNPVKGFHPNAMLPETKSHTYMNLVRDVIKQIK